MPISNHLKTTVNKHTEMIKIPLLFFELTEMRCPSKFTKMPKIHRLRPRTVRTSMSLSTVRREDRNAHKCWNVYDII